MILIDRIRQYSDEYKQSIENPLPRKMKRKISKLLEDQAKTGETHLRFTGLSHEQKYMPEIKKWLVSEGFSVRIFSYPSIPTKIGLDIIWKNEFIENPPLPPITPKRKNNF